MLLAWQAARAVMEATNDARKQNTDEAIATQTFRIYKVGDLVRAYTKYAKDYGNPKLHSLFGTIHDSGEDNIQDTANTSNHVAGFVMILSGTHKVQTEHINITSQHKHHTS